MHVVRHWGGDEGEGEGDGGLGDGGSGLGNGCEGGGAKHHKQASGHWVIQGELLHLSTFWLIVTTPLSGSEQNSWSMHGGGGGLGEGGGGGDDASGGGDKGGELLQTAASSGTRLLASARTSCARIALDGSVARFSSVELLTRVPKPHANTVAPSSLTTAAASTAVCHSVLPGAASTDCSPSVTISTTLVAPARPWSLKSCPAASKPSEIEVLPSADILSMPAWISVALYDHPTRVVASVAKDTTAKRTASTPRAYWLTSSLARALSPPGPSIEPCGLGFFIEPLSSSTKTKSTGVAQGGSGDGGGGGGEGDGGEGGGAGFSFRGGGGHGGAQVSRITSDHPRVPEASLVQVADTEFVHVFSATSHGLHWSGHEHTTGLYSQVMPSKAGAHVSPTGVASGQVGGEGDGLGSGLGDGDSDGGGEGDGGEDEGGGGGFSFRGGRQPAPSPQQLQPEQS